VPFGNIAKAWRKSRLVKWRYNGTFLEGSILKVVYRYSYAHCNLAQKGEKSRNQSAAAKEAKPYIITRDIAGYVFEM
jgi:hypothetical protein